MNKEYKRLVSREYRAWSESDDAIRESAADNGSMDKYVKPVSDIVGEKLYDKIADMVLDIVNEAQRTGFEIGFRHGIELMRGIMELPRD